MMQDWEVLKEDTLCISTSRGSVVTKKKNQEKATACAYGGTYKIVIVIMLLCSIEELGGVCFFYLILNKTLMLNNVNY